MEMRKGDCRDLNNSDKDRKEISASRESLSPKFLVVPTGPSVIPTEQDLQNYWKGHRELKSFIICLPEPKRFPSSTYMLFRIRLF